VAGLDEQAAEFAATLTRVANSTFASGAEFVAQGLAGRPIAWVWPKGSKIDRRIAIPVAAGFEEPRLWISARLMVCLDRVGDHLQVETSVFALCIDDQARPAVRIEYDRSQGSEPDDPPGASRRSAAHVHIHGTSAELTYALAMSGQLPRPLEKFHVPVGGRRFRPSLEDFVEFLHAEQLLPALHDGWEEVIGETRLEWLEKQLRAAIRNDQTIAADALRKLGWTVTGEVRDVRPKE
jgi:hypothetical protein